MTKFNKIDLAKRYDEDKSFQVGNVFPFKSHRYDISKHPVLKETGRKSAVIKAPISHQEGQMLQGLNNTFSSDTATSMRIALYEAYKRLQGLSHLTSRASSTSEIKGHTGRNTALSFKVNKTDKQRLEDISIKLGVSQAEALRTVLIWARQDTTADNAPSLSGCRKKSQKMVFEEWRGDKREAGKWEDDKPSVLGALREGLDEALEESYAANEALYERRGQAALEMSQAGLGALVYPGSLDEAMGDEYYDLREVNTEAVDQWLADEQEVEWNRELQMEIDHCKGDEVLIRIAKEDHYVHVRGYDIEFVEHFLEHGVWPWDVEEDEEEFTDEQLEELGLFDYDFNFSSDSHDGGLTPLSNRNEAAEADVRERAAKLGHIYDTVKGDYTDDATMLREALGEDWFNTYLDQD